MYIFVVEFYKYILVFVQFKVINVLWNIYSLNYYLKKDNDFLYGFYELYELIFQVIIFFRR